MLTNQVFRNKVIEIALGEDKTLTKTMPDKIQQYRDAVGINAGANWCAAFVYWCYQRTASTLGAHNPMIKTGSCSRLYRFAEEHGLFVDYPTTGDIYISHGKSHTGLIAEENAAYKTEKTATIEGNTWIGDHVWGVHKRKKDLSDAYFIRL
jgi:hypothetical protein